MTGIGYPHVNRVLNIIIIVLLSAMTVSLFVNKFEFSGLGISLSLDRLSKPLFYVMTLLYIKYIVYRPFRISANELLVSVAYEQKKTIVFFSSLILIILAFILLYFQFPKIEAWDLDSESGHATAFSGWLLISIAWAATIIYFWEKHHNTRLYQLWLPLIILFFYLAFDEVFSFHEWVPEPEFIEELSEESEFFEQFDWLRLYLPIFAVVGLFLIYFLYKKLLVFKSPLIIMVTGGFIYAMALGAEIVMQQFKLRGSSVHQIQVAFEEGFELFGSIFFLLACIIYFSYLLKEAHHEKGSIDHHYF